MKVIKKNGRLVDYDPNKIRTSLENCANDVGYILNDSDLDNIVNFANETLKNIRSNNSDTSSFEIRGVVLDALLNEDFIPVISGYIEKKI